MRNKKIVFLSVMSALVLVVVLLGIQACDLNGGSYGDNSSSGSGNNGHEEQLSTLFQKWQGEGEMTFTNSDAQTNFAIEFIDGEGIQISQFGVIDGGKTSNIQSFNVATGSFDIKSTADIDAYFARFAARGPGEYHKELFSFQLSDTELTLNIVGNNTFRTSQHIVTFRSDGTYKFLVFLESGTPAPIAPSEDQTAFNVDTDTVTTGWDWIGEFTRQ